jgi:hypothetical protein
MNQRLLEAAKKVAGIKAGECGCTKVKKEDFHKPSIDLWKPCPTCARIREIAKPPKPDLACELSPHSDCPYGFGDEEMEECHQDCDFHKPQHPDWTVQTVRALLEDLGEMSRAINWIQFQLVNLPDGCEGWTAEDIDDMFADILTSDELITEAATEYLEGLDE